LNADSVKAALDIDWNDEDEQRTALKELLDEVSRLESWVARRAKKEAGGPPLKDALVLLRRVVEQDTEPDPPDGRPRIKEGVAPDRIISIGDTEMRHGRKSKTKRFDGYKRHITIANGLILGTAVEPANVPEYVPAPRLLAAAERHGALEILDIDRGYLPSPAVEQRHRDGVLINSRAWQVNKHVGLYTKQDFHIDLRRHRVVCPAGKTAQIFPSGAAWFSTADCKRCPQKSRCTKAERRIGRRISSSSCAAAAAPAPVAPSCASAWPSSTGSLASAPSKAIAPAIEARARTNSTSTAPLPSPTCTSWRRCALPVSGSAL
jgi:hypothetical protein